MFNITFHFLRAFLKKNVVYGFISNSYALYLLTYTRLSVFTYSVYVQH